MNHKLYNYTDKIDGVIVIVKVCNKFRMVDTSGYNNVFRWYPVKKLVRVKQICKSLNIQLVYKDRR